MIASTVTYIESDFADATETCRQYRSRNARPARVSMFRRACRLLARPR